MKNVLILGIPMLAMGSCASAATLDKWTKDQACSQLNYNIIQQDTGRKDILGAMARFDVVKGPDVSYVLVGTSKQISAKKQYYCSTSTSISDCVFGSGQYAYWESEFILTRPKLVRTWEKDSSSNIDARDVHYTPTSRGIKRIIGVVTDKRFKVEVMAGVPAPALPEGMTYEWPSIPYFQDNQWLNDQIWNGVESLINSYQTGSGIPPEYASIPMCDAVEVRAQERPDFTGPTTFEFNPATEMFDVTASYSVDDYSEAAMESATNVTAIVRLQSIAYGTTSYVTKQFSAQSDTVHMSIAPNDGRGPYSISIQIQDGNFSSYQGKTVDTPTGYCMPKC